MVLMAFHEDGRTRMHVGSMCKFFHDGKSGKEGSTYLRTDVVAHARDVLHINLIEDM